MSKGAKPGPDGLSRDNYVAAVELLDKLAVAIPDAIPSDNLRHEVRAFLRDREGYDLESADRAYRGEDPVVSKDAKQAAQVRHNNRIREGVEEAVAEWLASIFRQTHPNAIYVPGEESTEITFKLKAGQVATGKHGEILYQVQVENRTKGVI